MVVDHSGMCLGFSLFRRSQPKESSEATLARMALLAEKGSLIVADSYFGSLRSVDELGKLGYEALLVCRKDRPSCLFKKKLLNNWDQKVQVRARDE